MRRDQEITADQCTSQEGEYQWEKRWKRWKCFNKWYFKGWEAMKKDLRCCQEGKTSYREGCTKGVEEKNKGGQS